MEKKNTGPKQVAWDKSEIEGMRAKGMSWEHIGAEFGVTKQAAINAATKMGIPARLPSKRDLIPPNTKITHPADKNKRGEAIVKMRKKGMTTAQVAKELGLCTVYVCQLSAKYGYTKFKRSEQ
jgi:hypothetical protein